MNPNADEFVPLFVQVFAEPLKLVRPAICVDASTSIVSIKPLRRPRTSQCLLRRRHSTKEAQEAQEALRSSVSSVLELSSSESSDEATSDEEALRSSAESFPSDTDDGANASEIQRQIRIANRAVGNFNKISAQNPKFIHESLMTLRHQKLDEIYRQNNRKWFMEYRLPDFHTVKLEQGKGAGKAVVLVLLPKNLDRVLIVNVFSRNHKAASHYKLHRHDTRELLVGDFDQFDDLLSSCSARGQRLLTRLPGRYA